MTATACGSAQRKKPEPPQAVQPLSSAAYSRYLRGRIAAIEGDYTTAAELFAGARHAAPGEAAIRVALADALYRSGDRIGALQVIETASAEFPSSSRVWQQRGRILRGLGRSKDAAAAYRTAIELAPDSEAAYLGLASSLSAMGEAARAEDTYRQLLERRPRSFAGHMRLARSLRGNRRFADAAVHLRLAVQLRPHNSRARMNLAQTLAAQRKWTEAADLLRYEFDRSGSSLPVAEGLFIDLLEHGEQRLAAILLERLDRDDLDLSIRVAFGYMYLQLGLHQRALALTDTLSAQHQPGSMIAILRARALAAGNDLDRAFAVLMAVPKEDPGFLDARLVAADIMTRADRLEQAARALADVEGQPAVPDVIIARARLAEAAGNVGRARTMLSQGARTSSDDWKMRMWFALAGLEDRQGQSDQAIEYAERVLEMDSEHVGALNFIGFTLADHGRELDRAERMLERAAELAPQSGHILDSLGWLRFRQKQYSGARRLLERAARLEPTEPEILLHLGELYSTAAQPGRARTALQRALRLAPTGDLRQRIEARLSALGK